MHTLIACLSLLECAGIFLVSSLDLMFVRRCVLLGYGVRVPGQLQVVPRIPHICFDIRPNGRVRGVLAVYLQRNMQCATFVNPAAAPN